MPARTTLRSAGAMVFTAALLASGAPAVTASADAAGTSATAGPSKIRCVNPDPKRGLPKAHRFKLPKRDWDRKLLRRSCVNKRGAVIVTIIWRKNAGTEQQMRRQLERAAGTKPGFNLVTYDPTSKKFKSPKRKTGKYEYTYRVDNGRRRVIAFGDRYTLLRVTGPNTRKAELRKAATLARKTMVRRLR